MSYGREAFSGSSLFLDIAIMLANAAMGSGWIAASVPPARTTSARPVRIISTAYPIASAPEAQAETGVCTPAWALTSRPTLAAGPFGMSMGTVCGETRRTPFSLSTSYWSSRVVTPPMPEAMTVPSRSGWTFSSSPALPV